MTGRHAWALALAAALLVVPAGARAETQLSFYLGWALARDADLRLETPDGTDVTTHGVAWRTRSFVNPLYYGVRVSRWLADRPELGLALDFTHAKIYLEDTAVRVSGVRAGTPVDRIEPVSDTIQGFNNSHGLNWLTLDLLRRWRGPGDAAGDGRRLRPYLGVGAGLAVPHVEAEIGGTRTFNYQVAGPVVQGLAGLSVRTAPDWSVFGEYKVDRAWLDEALEGGGTISTTVDLHQVVGGVSRRF